MTDTSNVPHDEQDEIPVNPEGSDEQGVDGADDDSPEVTH
jgi:hypothetical protein